MHILLDTHVLIWWLQGDARLSKAALNAIRDPGNEILVSAAVGWEIAIKVNLGKVSPSTLVARLEDVLSRETFVELPISVAHAVRAGMLPLHHRDPFDRLLAAQAELMQLPILSADKMLDAYNVRRMW